MLVYNAAHQLTVRAVRCAPVNSIAKSLPSLQSVGGLCAVSLHLLSPETCKLS